MASSTWEVRLREHDGHPARIAGRPGPYTMDMSITTGDYGDDMSGAVAAASWHEFDVTG